MSSLIISIDCFSILLSELETPINETNILAKGNLVFKALLMLLSNLEADGALKLFELKCKINFSVLLFFLIKATKR